MPLSVDQPKQPVCIKLCPRSRPAGETESRTAASKVKLAGNVLADLTKIQVAPKKAQNAKLDQNSNTV